MHKVVHGKKTLAGNAAYAQGTQSFILAEKKISSPNGVACTRDAIYCPQRFFSAKLLRKRFLVHMAANAQGTQFIVHKVA
jgi:hypothetical protein